MELILNGINGQYLRHYTENHSAEGKRPREVLAAVAYATDSRLLFDWCWKNKIPLKFWGRLDKDVAVSLPILKSFLDRRSHNFTCKLVQHHHAKIIWWKGIGVYIGSANFTDEAWNKNVEAGCFFEESEITSEMELNLEKVFSVLDKNASPLTDELYKEMKKRSDEMDKTTIGDDFYNKPSFKTWPGVVITNAKTANEEKKKEFLEEWYSTLQDLRNIGNLINTTENRPSWILENTPKGAQADQFLHAHYYERVSQRKGNEGYEVWFEKNESKKEAALSEAIKWWKNLSDAPGHEKIMLHESAPRLQKLLSKESLQKMKYEDFEEICSRVHAIINHVRHMPNRSLSLESGKNYSTDEKITALSKRIWNNKSEGGKGVADVLFYVIHGGSFEQLPERIWSAAVSDPTWKIRDFGISTYGELVGWALPDHFPPRNGRTSKALKSLGYDVTIHVA